MKNLLLFAFITISTLSFGQNPPVAVDDTLIYYYDEIHPHDSIKIFQSSWTDNDYNPDGTLVKTDTAFITGANSISIFKANGHLFWLTFYAPNNFVGFDSIKYVIKDNGSPIMYDTGTIYIEVKPQIHEILDANNIAARVDIFSLFSTYNGSPGFEAPAGSGSYSIFSSNLWVAGKVNNTVFSSIKRYGWAQDDFGTFTNDGSNTGPVSDSSAQYVEFNPKWDKVWKVKQYEIDYHLANWNSANYNPPPVFLTWPAHGDTTIGEAYYLAPFVDNDNDGHYNPYAGDYPVIKGDQAIYFIYNDGGSTQSLNPMRSEIHGMAYAFQCQDSALQNTIFVDYRIINRSNNTYDSTYFGMWTDGDLGDPYDDYIQCDVNRSLNYFYNGDDFDDDYSSRTGYGSHPAAQAIMTLKGAKLDNDGQDNAIGIGTNETINGTGFGDGITDNEHWGTEFFSYPYNNLVNSPNTDLSYYSKMSGTDIQGNPWAFDFLNTGTPIPFKFLFPGSSDTYSYSTNGTSVPGWTESSVGNSPGDRNSVSSTGPVTFAPGDEIELTYAFVFGRNYVCTGAQAGVTNMLKRADSIRSYYDQGMLSACGFPVSVKEAIDAKSSLEIYPNPTNNLINIRQEKASSITIQVLDITGKILITTFSTNQLTTIDLSEFTNGIYLVKVTSGNSITVEKIIKN